MEQGGVPAGLSGPGGSVYDTETQIKGLALVLIASLAIGAGFVTIAQAAPGQGTARKAKERSASAAKPKN